MKLRCKLFGRKGYACKNCSGIIVIDGKQLRLLLNGYGRIPNDCPYNLADPTKSDKVEIIEK